MKTLQQDKPVGTAQERQPAVFYKVNQSIGE
jgi:hypothetical protein